MRREERRENEHMGRPKGATPPKVPRSYSIDPEIVAIVETTAERLGISRSQIVEAGVRLELARLANEQRRGERRAGGGR